MQTSFTLAQLADPHIAEADKILRTCVHCGFCTATCPTYVLLGDELDSPRGRIYLIKDMLENDRPATAEVVKHIDRCLSCLACMTTCPPACTTCTWSIMPAPISSEPIRGRRWPIAGCARCLRRVLPHNRRFRRAMRGAARQAVCPLVRGARARADRRDAAARAGPAAGGRPGRAASIFADGPAARTQVALLDGCVEPVLAPSINAAAIRVLTRHGIEVVVAGEGCCGSLVHHMGREQDAHGRRAPTIDAWTAEFEGDGLDAIVITASGCGTMVKDYGFMLRNDPAYADKAARVSRLALDICEYLAALNLSPRRDSRPGRRLSRRMLAAARPENRARAKRIAFQDWIRGERCSGSTFVLWLGRHLQHSPAGACEEVARAQSRQYRKLTPDVIAAGNIGCMTQIATGTAIPVVHTVELIDWATGGPAPEAFAGRGISSTAGEAAAVAM